MQKNITKHNMNIMRKKQRLKINFKALLYKSNIVLLRKRAK